MCGPEPFWDSVRTILGRLDYDMADLHAESFGGVRTSTKNKPAPIVFGGGTTADDGADAAAGAFKVEFAKSGKVNTTDGTTPLLDFAEENDVDIDYACRSGSCGECKVRLLKGEVDMESDDGLSAAEKSEGYVLTCVATPKGSVTLDA